MRRAMLAGLIVSVSLVRIRVSHVRESGKFTTSTSFPVRISLVSLFMASVDLQVSLSQARSSDVLQGSAS
jgi:hypothetical protein